MSKIDFVFIVLTFKNTDDIKELVDSIKKNFAQYLYKIVIVNSYFDETTKNIIINFAKNNYCDFFNIENKGYGYGNNQGIIYANKKYNYKFLIIANPDTKIIKNNFNFSLYESKKIVIAPIIKNLLGKNQNPYWVIKNRITELLIYIGYKRNLILLTYLGIIINKIVRIIFNKFNHNSYIYAAHGSFVIFSKKTLETIGLPYDEKMFLFGEEKLLAHILENKKIQTYYTKKIEILHKEDGSLKLSNIIEKEELSKSTIYYYEKIKNELR